MALKSRLDETGQKLRVGTNKWLPYFMVSRENGQNRYSGFSVDLLDILADTLNFTYRFVTPPDGEWGDKRDGNWTGLIGLLERKEADIVLPLAPSAERSEAADWTVPFDYWYNGVAVRRVHSTSASGTAFIAPFHWMVYVCIAVTFVLATLVLLGLLCAEKSMSPERKTHATSTQTIVQNIEIMFGSLLNKAVTEPLRTGAGRTFLFTWNLMALLLMSYYTCKLTSLMVDVTSSPPFTSLAEMVKRDGQRWGILGSGTKLQKTLRESPYPVEHKIYLGLLTFAQDDPDVMSADQNVHFSKVLSENYAYIDHGPYMERWASTHCDVEVLPLMVTGFETYNCFLQKGSPLRADIDTVLLGLLDSGVLSHIRSKWFPADQGCNGNKTVPKAITLATLQGPFYITCGGLILASTVVLVELFAKKNRCK